MTDYAKGSDKPVPHKTSKYDGFKIVNTGKPYRCQKGSGRMAVFAVAKDGMLIGTWTKKCAEQGASNGRYYESRFVIGSLDKLSRADYAGWTFSAKNDKGKTLEEVRKIRDIDPSKLAERQERAKAMQEAKKAKKAEKDEAKAKKLADKKADQEAKAAEKANKDAKQTAKKKAA